MELGILERNIDNHTFVVLSLYLSYFNPAAAASHVSSQDPHSTDFIPLKTQFFPGQKTYILNFIYFL